MVFRFERVFVLVVFGFLLFGCTQPSVSPSASASALPLVSVTATTAGGLNQVNEIQVEVGKFYFKPSEITVKKGEKVRLVLNTTDEPHGIAIPGFKIEQTLPIGVSIVEFTAEQAGVFPFRCNVFCGSGHRQMVGNITVTG